MDASVNVLTYPRLRHGAGVDLAWSANGYVYHTPLDTADAVPDGALQRTGDNVLALAAALLRRPELGGPRDLSPPPVYFDVLGVGVVLAGPGAALAVALAGGLLVAFALYLGAAEMSRYTGGHAAALCVTAARLTAAGACGVAAAVALAGLLTAADARLSWFCKPALLVPLYAAPAFGVAGLVLVRMWPSGSARAPLGGWLACAVASDALLAMWATLSLVCAACGLRSGFLAALWALCPAAARVAAHYAGGPRLLWVALGAALPSALTCYLAAASLEMFIPIMGRVGADLPAEVTAVHFY